MYSNSMKIAELMCDVSELMLKLGPSNTMKTMQRMLIDMAIPKEAANDSEAQANKSPPKCSAQARTRSGLRSLRRAPRAAFTRVPRFADPGRDRRSSANEENGAFGTSSFIAGSISNEAGTRDYKLYVPSSYRGQALPLIVMLHGCKQDPDDFALGTRMNEVADQEQCFVLYPAQTKSASRPKCWNWFVATNQQRDQGEPSLIADMMREVMFRYRVDERRVYIAGLSAGGAMASIMAAAYPEMFAAAAVHSGVACNAADNLFAALMAMKHGPRAQRVGESVSAAEERAVPVIVFHGDADTVVHPSNSDLVIRQALGMPESECAAQAPASTSIPGVLPEGRSYTRTLHHDENGQLLAEQWVIHGSGHAWSGGSDDGSYTDPLGPDATREMMRFFSEHARPGKDTVPEEHD